ncbi:MAG TPA: hypothetical protein VMC05_16655, partial [Xanthobacteraceae bacterium]|nr:hypothetical protein [Xanthobacteraceae bacterium]
MYDDDRDALAAEYVLGTLSPDERDQAEALLVIDPGFAELVRLWERRLGELNVMVEAVEPAPELWDRIKTGIDGAERRIAAETEATLPAMEEAAPQIAPEAPAQVAPEPAVETPTEPTMEAPPQLYAEPAANLDAAQPQDELQDDLQDDLDDAAAIAALASSLLTRGPAETEKPSAAEPAAAPAPPKIERSADVIYLARQAQRWRGFTVAMSALAALLAVYIGVGQLAPSLLPVGRMSPPAETPPPMPQSRLVAVLQQEPTAP